MASWPSEDEDVDGAALAALHVHDAGPARAERIRERCLASLAARRRPAAPPVARAAGFSGWLEPVFALGLGALFLAEAVSRALAVYR